MDKLYLDLTKNIDVFKSESVHLTKFPSYDSSQIDFELERKMKYAQQISSMALSLRAKEKIKVRQPLNKIMIPVSNNHQKKEIQAVSELIKNEVNVKEIQLLEGESDILVKTIKPNFKVLGPKYGSLMKEISIKTAHLNSDDIKILEQTGYIDLEINEKSITLELDDFEIISQDIEGWLVTHEGSLTVALDIVISEKLKGEGVAREIVSKIQNIRKNSNFEVTDRINISLLDDANIKVAVQENLNYIMTETLADNLDIVSDLKNGDDIVFDDVKTKIFITKI
jgi:isoleucyl-tRNA synthetase